MKLGINGALDGKGVSACWFNFEEVVLGTLGYPPLHIRRDLVWIGGQYGDFLAACRLM